MTSTHVRSCRCCGRDTQSCLRTHCPACEARIARAVQLTPPIVATGISSPSAKCGRCGSWVEPACIRAEGCCDCVADDMLVVEPAGAVA